MWVSTMSPSSLLVGSMANTVQGTMAKERLAVPSMMYCMHRDRDRSAAAEKEAADIIVELAMCT